MTDIVQRSDRPAIKVSLKTLTRCLVVVFVAYTSLLVVYVIKNSYDNDEPPVTFIGNPNDSFVGNDDESFVLTAYLEFVNQTEWEIKPLPYRAAATKEQLTKIEYPGLKSCAKFTQQFPVDDYPDDDPFLPWIHDVFPTQDGKYVQIVGQNKRRCHTGTTSREKEILRHTQPQAALFQHVAVKRVEDGRYQLVDHQEADPDGMATRFLCRFKPSMQETLSVFNVDYDYASWRKGHVSTFTLEGRDNSKGFTSQLMFLCPVPDNLQATVRLGTSVKNDTATLFVDIIPIRTPVRYGPSNAFFPPWYQEFQASHRGQAFHPKQEWGQHVLPRIEDSGRWDNIPICKPTLKTYRVGKEFPPPARESHNLFREHPKKIHRLVACTWASAVYFTRGKRFQVGDGKRRMREWVHFHRLVGVEHFYVYDNSGAHTNESSLQPIADMFPEHITIVPWPAKVCNNNPNNVDSCGERSSQYAAETSCRLRFGPYAEWIAGVDIDEYLVPMGKYDSLLPLLDRLDEEGTKMINFKSWRSWPRKKLMEAPEPVSDRGLCGTGGRCFDVSVPEQNTMLQTYNCERERGPKRSQMPAEKQIYRPDYVKLHFIHYSMVTEFSAANKTEYERLTGHGWQWPTHADERGRFSDELLEGTMLHAKAIARQDTVHWDVVCKDDGYQDGFRLKCRIGNPFPRGALEKNVTADSEGWRYNCFTNDKIEHYYVPLLEESMESTQTKYNSLIQEEARSKQ